MAQDLLIVFLKQNFSLPFHNYVINISECLCVQQNDMYGPGPGKRPDYMNQQPPMARGMTPYNQSSNFPPQQGNFPGDRGPHDPSHLSYPPSYRDRGPGATGHGEIVGKITEKRIGIQNVAVVPAI